MINTLTIFAAGAAEGRGVACHATPAAPSSPCAARCLGVPLVNAVSARRFPATARLPAGFRTTFSLPAPAFYSP
jgi:hypothetical protein